MSPEDAEVAAGHEQQVTQEVHSLWLRLWHHTQATCFLGMLATGLSMHYADAGFVLVPFRFAVITHNVLGAISAVLWLAFVLGNLLSGNVRFYFPSRRHHGQNLVRQLRYYLWGMFHGEPHPFPPGFGEQKFNPVQKLAYTTVMYALIPLSIASGAVLMFPLVAPEHWAQHAGLWPAAMLHLAVGYLMTIFLLFHIYLATTGDHVTTLYREMVTGLRTSAPPPPRRGSRAGGE